jgi:hypothetical protein
MMQRHNAASAAAQRYLPIAANFTNENAFWMELNFSL